MTSNLEGRYVFPNFKAASEEGGVKLRLYGGKVTENES